MAHEKGVPTHEETAWSFEESIHEVAAEPPIPRWPFDCKYFLPELMDGVGALELLDSDAEFFVMSGKDTEALDMFDITSFGTSSYTIRPWERHFQDRLQLSDLEPGGTRIVFVPQKRLYPKNRTVNTYGIQHSTWLRALAWCSVPPDAVQILHENNGGWASHTSYCVDVRSTACGLEESSSPEAMTPCAYHIWLKPRPWWNEEHFVYARHDLHSGRNLLLIAGTSAQGQVHRLTAQLNHAVQPHLFSVLLALVTTWTKDLEKFLWEQDFATQQLESDTGWSVVFHTQAQPLPPEKLALRKSLVTTKDSLFHVVRASESYTELFDFLSKEVCLLSSPHLGRAIRSKQLHSMFLQHKTRQRHLNSQAHALIGRIDAQWSVVNALIVQHSNSLNYQIASDSRTDTIAMRRISYLTIAFLPATFLATFFSMTFFHVTGGRVHVSSTIWIYVACVIPVTLIVAWQSSTTGLSQTRWLVSKLTRSWKRKGMIAEKSSRLRPDRQTIEIEKETDWTV